MKKYQIIGNTNGWIANRDILFKECTTITIHTDMTLKEAQNKLLEMYNEKYDKSYTNWGQVTRNNLNASTRNDGTRKFEYDSRYFSIEKMEE